MSLVLLLSPQSPLGLSNWRQRNHLVSEAPWFGGHSVFEWLPETQAVMARSHVFDVIVRTWLTLGPAIVWSMMSLSCVSLMTCTEDCILHTTRNKDSKEQKETSDGTLLDDVCFGCPCVMLMALMLFDFSLIVLKTLTSRSYSLPHISQTSTDRPSVPGYSILHLQHFRPNLLQVYCLSTSRLSGVSSPTFVADSVKQWRKTVLLILTACLWLSCTLRWIYSYIAPSIICKYIHPRCCNNKR